MVVENLGPLVCVLELLVCHVCVGKKHPLFWKFYFLPYLLQGWNFLSTDHGFNVVVICPTPIPSIFY